MKQPLAIIIMGVSGCGKTTVGKLLSERTGIEFLDGDDFHSPANKQKMANGLPLNDDDRAGWLTGLADLLKDRLSRGKSTILACSALKQKYRDILHVQPGNVRFVYLKGSYDDIYKRMKTRSDHYMKAGMLRSQFETLEEPADALTVDITLALKQKIDSISQRLL
jgi:gluconokinase